MELASYVVVEEFLTFFKKFCDSLYSNQPMGFGELKKKYEDLKTDPALTTREIDYILSQFISVEGVNKYTIPVLKACYERMKLRFETFYI